MHSNAFNKRIRVCLCRCLPYNDLRYLWFLCGKCIQFVSESNCTAQERNETAKIILDLFSLCAFILYAGFLWLMEEKNSLMEVWGSEKTKHESGCRSMHNFSIKFTWIQILNSYGTIYNLSMTRVLTWQMANAPNTKQKDNENFYRMTDACLRCGVFMLICIQFNIDFAKHYNFIL